MSTWWPLIGQTSLIAGAACGIIWALLSTSLRRRKFLSHAVRPVGQGKWFALQMLAMGAYIAQITGLGLSAVHGHLPVELFWFLLALSLAAFAMACAMAAAILSPAEGRRRRSDGPVTGGQPAEPAMRHSA